MDLQDLGVAGIIGIVILAFASIGFLKGLIRTVLAMVCLAIAGYAALWGNEHANDLTAPWITQPGEWMPKFIALVTGLAVFFICRFLLNFLVDPFNRSKTGKRIGFGIPAALLSLCSGLVVLWLAFTGIRYGGSLAELRHTRYQLLKDSESSSTDTYAIPLMLKAKHALDASSVGKWQQGTDPFYSPEKLTLCKILIIYHHTQTRETLLKKPALNQVLNHPAFLKLAYEENIKNLARSAKPRELFSEDSVDEALLDPKLMALLRKIDSP